MNAVAIHTSSPSALSDDLIAVSAADFLPSAGPQPFSQSPGLGCSNLRGVNVAVVVGFKLAAYSSRSRTRFPQAKRSNGIRLNAGRTGRRITTAAAIIAPRKAHAIRSSALDFQWWDEITLDLAGTTWCNW
jgi:hypothetical protein